MNNEKIIGYCAGILALILLFGMVFDIIVFEPKGDQDAVQQCIDAGYGHTFVQASRVPFTITALGVKCIESAKQYEIRGINSTIILPKG